MKFTSKIIGDELYVFYKGQLIYKKWLKTNQPSKLFNRYWPNVDIR